MQHTPCTYSTCLFSNPFQSKQLFYTISPCLKGFDAYPISYFPYTIYQNFSKQLHETQQDTPVVLILTFLAFTFIHRNYQSAFSFIWHCLTFKCSITQSPQLITFQVIPPFLVISPVTSFRLNFLLFFIS